MILIENVLQIQRKLRKFIQEKFSSLLSSRYFYGKPKSNKKSIKNIY